MTAKKLRVLTDLSLNHDHSFMANSPAAEKACSATTDVGGMLNKALKSCSNLRGFYLVASSNFIYGFIIS